MNKTLFALILFTAFDLQALVPKKLLVEHFTNTVCSVCASRNPGFRNNLQTQSDAIYISYHPSSPYPTCQFNLANKSGNDTRTNFYSIYGSTPRLVINGKVINANDNYGSASLFTPFLNQTSSFDVVIRQFKTASSINIQVIIIKKDTFSGSSNAKIYLAASEDSIAYNAPNGEKNHFNVFRKAISDQGNALTLPSTINDSTVMSFYMPLNQTWSINRIKVTGILSDANGNYLQAAETNASENNNTLAVKDIQAQAKISVYPNPASQFINIQTEVEIANAQFSIYNSLGIRVLLVNGNNKMLDVSSLTAGIYFLKMESAEFQQSIRFLKVD